MVNPKVAYKGLREELRPLLVAGDFLNSEPGPVSCDLPGLSPCTWTTSRRVFQLPAWICISDFSAAFLLRHGPTPVLLSFHHPSPAFCVFQKRAMGHPGQVFELSDCRPQGTSRYLRYSPSAPMNNLWSLPEGLCCSHKTMATLRRFYQGHT